MKVFSPSQQILFLLIAALAVAAHTAKTHRKTLIPNPSKAAAQGSSLAISSLRQQLLMGMSIPLNKATADDLRLIPGISTTLAHRIVNHRKRHGPFQRWFQLKKVHGLGPKTLAKLRPYVRLDGTTGIKGLRD